jgi:hypothetical protein
VSPSEARLTAAWTEAWLVSVATIEPNTEEPLQIRVHKRSFPDIFITAASRSWRCAAATLDIRLKFHGKQKFSFYKFFSSSIRRAHKLEPQRRILL